ncbi:MAG: gephyrin-like molybdotransferase Glp [Vicinamibacterales bacterium]
MRPFASTISIDDARRRLAEDVRPIGRTEILPITEAAGRVAATDVVASMFVPPFARSLMDGYAVVATDTSGASRRAPARLAIAERIYTGMSPTATLGPGRCSEIATGAPLPDGADAVVMVEETTPAGDEAVQILSPVSPGQNVGRRGADLTPGDLVVRRGDLLNPSRIGALAAVGAVDIEVYVRPRVAVMSTGNEIVRPGDILTPSQIYDVNLYTLTAVVAAHGGAPEPHDVVPDTLDALEEALDRCGDADIIVFSGGSSVGERDLILDLVRRRGQMIFHGIAVRPGKPTAFARIGDAAFFGMPGNPTSCLSNAYILLVPYLRAAARLPPEVPRRLPLRLGRRIVSAAGRHQFYTVRIENGMAMPAFKGSGDITSMSRADGYIEIPADQSTVEEGTLLEVTLF